jgi:hypothetical protein
VKEGSICRRCGGSLRQPLARDGHCCTIMQDLIFARARETKIDSRKVHAATRGDC